MRWRAARESLCGLLTVAVLGQGCATQFPVNDRVGAWPHRGYRAEQRWATSRSNELLFMLAFSGGGTRASAYSYGVLEELEATPVASGERTLLDEVDHLTSVSGGSFTAAYFALRGKQIFEDFEERFLTRNVQWALLAQMLWPWNWPALFSPYFERTDLVARYYDRILFDDATFADLAEGGGPFVQINATDLATGAPFSFIQEQFDYLCSDILPYKVSRAVAASSAVPGPMSPLTLRNFAGECPFVPPQWIDDEIAQGDAFGRSYMNASNLASYLEGRRRFIRLVDGGISDNLGVRGPFEAALMGPPPDVAQRPADFGELRWVVLVVVNAATTPEAVWEEAPSELPLVNLIDIATTVQMNRYNVETLELLRAAYRKWNEVASQWDQPIGFHLVELDFARVKDPNERRALNVMPTTLGLSEERVAQLRAAARRSLAESPAWRAFVESYRAGADAP